jgi:protein ImuA
MRSRRDRAELLARLRDKISGGRRLGDVTQPIIRTRWPALNRVLPGGGIRHGSLVELLDQRAGCGAETVAAGLTANACEAPGMVVIVDREGQFYPPALAAWGVPVDRMVIVRAGSDADAVWTADQALRSRAAVAVWLRLDRLRPHDFRRFRLAAEEGGAIGIVFRPNRVRGQPTWADVQLAVEPQPSAAGRKLRVEVMRCRGGMAGTAVIEIGDSSEHGPHETPHVFVPARLAGAAAVG